MRIALDCLPKQIERSDDSFPIPGARQGTQIEIVGSKVARRPICRTADLSGLKGRFDDARYADCYFVLQFEDVFERTVEVVGPEMRAGYGVDQLSGDANPLTRSANASFQNISDTEFPSDLLHVDGLTFVSEARIAGDHEEPADAGERRDDLLDH